MCELKSNASFIKIVASNKLTGLEDTHFVTGNLFG